jgi:U3 small nucleolar RNA-associated protein 10
MVLSALKGVGSILFEAEVVKTLFLYLLDHHSRHQNGHDSKQLLSTYETQILCLLLKVNTSSSCMYIHSKVLCI